MLGSVMSPLSVSFKGAWYTKEFAPADLRATYCRWKAFSFHNNSLQLSSYTEIDFHFGGPAAANLHRNFCGCRFTGMRDDKSIRVFKEFCEAEDTVFIGFLVLVGFKDANISTRKGPPCALLIDSALNIAGLG